MGMGFINGRMGTDMKVSGEPVSDMEMVLTSLRMVINTLGSTNMEIPMVLVNISGQMETHMPASFKMD